VKREAPHSERDRKEANEAVEAAADATTSAADAPYPTTSSSPPAAAALSEKESFKKEALVDVDVGWRPPRSGTSSQG